MVIDDIVSGWPAREKWTHNWLASKYGDREVTCFVADKDNADFLQQVNISRSMSFSTFLEHIYSPTEGDRELYYLRIDTTHPLFQELSKDFEIPKIVDGYNSDYTGIWMGQKGNITPFHHDWWHSFLAQVSGRKRYTIVHPFEGKILQEKWSNAAKFDLEPAPHANATESRSENFATIFEGVLEPGQILYIPPYWFHEIETLENGNISMPLRYDTLQSPDTMLFQFSQDSLLRPLTNNQTTKEETLVDYLKTNREKFFQKETAFIQAFLKARGINKTFDEIAELLNNHSR
ncbi:MAG: cupin-like domain-containing protein [Nitrospinales bacterium]